MGLESVQEALYRIEDWELQNKREMNVDMIFFDYLQRIPFDSKPESKVIGIDENLNKLKDIGLVFSCPVVVGVQARREVDDRDPAVPDLNDGQWCSGVEQVSDKVMSVVRPIKYRKEGDLFGKKVLVQGRNQMLITVLKQKLGDAPFSVWTIFDPQYNRMMEAEERNYDLNKMAGRDY
jgi:replicative DNA helicase